MTNLQTSHRLNTAEINTKNLLSSTFIATAFSLTVVAQPIFPPMQEAPPRYTVEHLEQAGGYVAEHVRINETGVEVIRLLMI